MKKSESIKPLLPLGSIVKPYGKVGAVGWTGGERYYWFVDKDGSVAMMPASCLPTPPQEGGRG